MSRSSLMHPFHPASLLSQSPHFSFYSHFPCCPLPLFSPIFMDLFYTLTRPPPPPPPATPPCSQIAHKLTLKASIIAYVKTRTNAQSAAYLTGLILSSCKISPAPLIHTVFMLND